MANRFTNLQLAVEAIHRRALEAMTKSGVPGKTKSSLKLIADEALALSRMLGEAELAECQTEETKTTKRNLLITVREFLLRVVTVIWRSDNGT